MYEKNQNYAKHKGLKMETINKGVKYALTFSPPDVRQYSSKVYRNTVCKLNIVQMKEQFIEQYRNIEKKLKTRLLACKIELYPELSPTGRLHFHGECEIKDIFTFYYHDLYVLEQEGMYELDTIDNKDNKWVIYKLKQKHIFEKLFDEWNIDYPMRNYDIDNHADRV